MQPFYKKTERLLDFLLTAVPEWRMVRLGVTLMSLLYMVRHGQASFGDENYDVLSPRGVEQSRILADYLVELGILFDAVYTGTMDRQTRTAREIIARYRERGLSIPDPCTMPHFNEYDSKAITLSQVADVIREAPELGVDLDKIYTDRKAFQRVFERVMLRWVTGKHDKPGVESWAEVNARVGEGLKAVMAETGRNRTVLVVASGGTISASVRRATGVSDENTMQLCWQIVNSSITRFMYDGERITLSVFNSYPHLELKKDRTLVTYR